MSDSTAPAGGALAITKSDSATLQTPRALYVGGAGDVTVRFSGNDTDVVFKAIGAGTILPIRPSQVRNATTATDIIALY